MSKPQLRVTQKLLGGGYAADGPRSGGVRIGLLIMWLSDLESKEVRNAAATLADGDGPVERCLGGNYRLTSIDAGEAFVQQELPLVYWASP